MEKMCLLFLATRKVEMQFIWKLHPVAAASNILSKKRGLGSKGRRLEGVILNGKSVYPFNGYDSYLFTKRISSNPKTPKTRKIVASYLEFMFVNFCEN
jgi:hypothetical protein